MISRTRQDETRCEWRARPMRLALCAEHQGEDTLREASLGTPRSVDEIIEQAGESGEIDVIVYCLGTSTRWWRHPRFRNVIYRQYTPNLSVWEAVPGTPCSLLPYVVDLLPIHPSMLRDLVRDAPDVIHTFGTFGATDLAGFAAARWLRRRGTAVRLVSSVVTLTDSYVADSARRVMTHFCARLDARGLRGSIADALARPGGPGTRTQLSPFAIVFWAALSVLADAAHRVQIGLERLCGAGIERPPRHVLPELIARVLHAALQRQAPMYLAGCDAVTTPQSEDGRRYNLAQPAWPVPHGSDPSHFNVLEARAGWIGEQLVRAARAAGLSADGVVAIERLVTDPVVAVRRPILHVGRQSDDQGFDLVLDAFSALLDKAGEASDVHLVCVGEGAGGERAQRLFGESVSLCGWLPNALLPLVYNLVRARGGFLVSAADSEAYGLVHQEAGACGLPVVAMERGRRTHLFVAGDLVGDDEVAEDHATAGIVRLLAFDSLSGEHDSPHLAQAHRQAPMSGGGVPLTVARNGLGVCDQTEGAGLAKLLLDDPRRVRTQRAFEAAVCGLARLPGRDMARLSAAAQELTHRHRASWSTVWQLLRHVYEDDRGSHRALAVRYDHVPVEQLEAGGSGRILSAPRVAPAAVAVVPSVAGPTGGLVGQAPVGRIW